MSSPPLLFLREQARSLKERAHAPFSQSPAAAVLLLSDGSWIPGVRVESASYSLTIPALLNAYTTVVAAKRSDDIVAIVRSHPFRREERLYIDDLPHGPFTSVGEDGDALSTRPLSALPSPDTPLLPFLSVSIEEEDAGIQVARRLSRRAYVPASDFPVGVLLETEDHAYVPGVNVEHPDWARILCAERNALGTVQSYAAGPVRRLFLSCPTAPNGTPCGACRQLLAELAPESVLWMDRHDETPAHAPLSDLLPGSFRGRSLLSS